MKLTFKGLSTAIGLAVLVLVLVPSTLRAQVRPLPVIPPDSLVQTYTGRLAHTLLNHYVTHDSLHSTLNDYVLRDSLNATLDNYVTHDDSRLSDSRTPKGTAGGDLTGNYPNPAIKSSVTLTGNPTVTGNLTTNGNLAVNGTGESRIWGNLRLKGSGNSGNKINLGDGDYVYLHEATDDNLTIKASNILLSPTVGVTAPTPASTDNSTKVATTAYVKSNLSGYVTTSDSRLSNARTPTGTAGGDLTGTYPNPTIKSSVTLTGNPTVTGNLTANGNLTSGGTLTVNGTGESLIKGNLRLKGSSAYGNKINLGDGDYVYLHEATDDNLTVKAKNIYLSPTTSVTAPTPASTDNSTKVATTAYVQSNLANRIKVIAAGHYAAITVSGQTYLSIGNWTSNNTSTGTYSITVNAGVDLTKCVVLVTGLRGYVATLYSQSSSSFVVKLYNGTTLANATTVSGGFYFVVLGF